MVSVVCYLVFSQQKGGTISLGKSARATRLFLWLFLSAASTPLWSAEISLTANSLYSQEGYFVLSWNTNHSADKSLILQQSTSESFAEPRIFTVLPVGSITITGLENGTYYYRLVEDQVAATGVVSDVVTIEVTHHSLQRALLFFAIGLALFLILVVTIVKGNRQHVH